MAVPGAFVVPHTVAVRKQRLGGRAFAAVLCYFAITGAIFGWLGINRMFDEWHWLNDLHFFRDSAVIATSGQAEILHDPEARAAAVEGLEAKQEVFPFPATLALLFWPLTLIGFDPARLIFMAMGVLAAAAIALAAYVWSRDPLLTLLVALTPASLFPFYESLRFSQLSPVLALMLCLALVTSISARSLPGGALTALLVLKPSLAVAPLLLLTLRRGYAQIAVAALVAGAVALAIPLTLVGVDGLKDYLDQLGRYREESFVLDGKFTAGAGWMLGWQGLIGKATGSDPSLLAVLPLDALTLLLMLRVWRRGRFFDSWLAGMVATLLVVPHAVWYDWVTLIGVAPFVVYASRSGPLLLLLLALHLTVSIDSYVIMTTAVTDFWLFTTPLIAAALLVYLAASKGTAAPEIAEPEEQPAVLRAPA